MKQIGYVFFGWLLGVVSMFISMWLQAKEDKRKKEIDIISEVLTYLFKIKQTFNNFLTDRLWLEKVRGEYPDKASETEKKCMLDLTTNFRGTSFPTLCCIRFNCRGSKTKHFGRTLRGLWKNAMIS